jgi:hypothetical protein
MNHKRGAKIFGMVLAGLALAGVLGLALGYIVMWLWNALMPSIFGLPLIGYWQAVGLFILAHLLFKGPCGHHNPHQHDRCTTRPQHGDKIHAKVRAWLNDETSPCDDKAATSNETA